MWTTEDEIALDLTWEEGSKLPVKKKWRDEHWIISFDHIEQCFPFLQPDLVTIIKSDKMFGKKILARRGAALISDAARLDPNLNASFLNILRDLEPDGLQLFPHQEAAVKFVELTGGRALIADDPGLGKTATAIMWARMNKSHTIVMCPSSTKWSTWHEEICRWDPDAKIMVLDKSAKHPDAVTSIPEYVETDWVILSYHALKDEDLIWALREETMFQVDDIGFNTMILDECHVLKNYGASRTMETRGIANHMEHVIGLSGTPIENRPAEFWSILTMIDDNIWNDYFQFIKRYCGAKKTRWGWTKKGATHLDELQEKLRPMMLRRTKSILDLPQVYRYRHYSEIGASRYRKMVDSVVHAKSPIVLLPELQRQLYHRKAVQIRRMAKKHKPCLIFAHHQEVITDLVESLGAPAIRGSTLSARRKELIDEFQAGEFDILICSIEAVNTGVNLTRADNVLFAQRPWTPSKEEQAIARTHRIGRKTEIGVHYFLVRNTMDEIIDSMLAEKGVVINKVIVEMLK